MFRPDAIYFCEKDILSKKMARCLSVLRNICSLIFPCNRKSLHRFIRARRNKHRNNSANDVLNAVRKICCTFRKTICRFDICRNISACPQQKISLFFLCASGEWHYKRDGPSTMQPLFVRALHFASAAASS